MSNENPVCPECGGRLVNKEWVRRGKKEAEEIDTAYIELHHLLFMENYRKLVEQIEFGTR